MLGMQQEILWIKLRDNFSTVVDTDLLNDDLNQIFFLLLAFVLDNAGLKFPKSK